MSGCRIEQARTALCAIAVAFGISVLIGWQLDIQALKALFAIHATMKVNTAIAIISLAASVLCIDPSRPSWRTWMSAALSSFAIIIGMATIGEYVSHTSFGIDELFYKDRISNHYPYPGRMSAIASVSFVCLGLSSLAMLFEDRPLAVKFGQGIAILPLAVGYLSFVSYLYGTENLYVFGPYITIACNTALCLVFIGASIMMTRYKEGFLAEYVGRPIAIGVLINSIVRAVFVPTVLGFLIVLGVRSDYYNNLFGPSLYALGTALVLLWHAVQSSRTVCSAEDAVMAASAEISRQREALRLSEEQFHTVADAMPNIIWVADPDGGVTWYNRRTMEFSGLSMETLCGEGWAHFVHPDDVGHTRTRWNSARLAGVPYFNEIRLKRYDGTFRWYIAQAEPIRTKSGELIRWIGVNTDITDQKEAEIALEKRIDEAAQDKTLIEDQLRQSQKMEAVGQLTGGLAHDFNNLLAAISGSLELIDRRVANQKYDKIDRYVQTAMQATSRAATLTNRLLAFSRRQTLDPHSLVINDLVANMTELVKRTVGPGIKVKVVKGDEPWLAFVDANQLENSLLNLCINARDAMPDGGTLTIEVLNRKLTVYEARLLDLPTGEYVKLRVTDTGSGMPPDVKARAFDPFFTTKPMGQGTGLGLSMVYGFVRQSGGRVRIVSETNHGTQVTITLPRESKSTLVVDAAHAVVAQAAIAAAEKTVLIVEDEPSVRMVVVELLEELGHRVLEAEDSQTGLRILQSAVAVDLLVSDVGLPGGMNGRQMADAARSTTRPDMRVLFITGYAEKAAIGDTGLPVNMAVITKPFALDVLGTKITEMLSEDYKW